jgi:3-methyladenine DNA glycosylase Tag
MSGHLVPGDEAFHDDKQLMADLTVLNGQLSRYVLQMLDADAKRAQPIDVADERTFAQTLRAMAERLQERADRRTGPETPPALEGGPARRQLTNGRPSESC